MGAKSLYLDNRKKYREQLRIVNDLKAQEALNRGLERYRKYKNMWKTLDLDEVVNKLFKNPTYINQGQKYVITDIKSNYIIYCDNGGSYFRIGNKEIPISHKGHYVGVDLQSVLNEKVNGKISGLSGERREALTHFRMKIKKGGTKA